MLRLFDNFGIEEFLLPLILQDKLVCVDEFLTESPQHQYKLVSYLDSVLGESIGIKAALEPLIR